MNSIAVAGYGDIASRVDQQAGCWFAGIFLDSLHRSANQSFEFASREIFLPQLNEVNAGASCLGDFRKQSVLARVLVTRKFRAIGDIAKKQGYGLVFAIPALARPHLYCFGPGRRWYLVAH